MSDVYTVRVVNCSRCGETHDAVTFREFTAAERIWDRWALCPETGEPILMMMVEEGASVAEEIRRRAEKFAVDSEMEAIGG